jgi:Protein of unknown function (DUF3499)
MARYCARPGCNAEAAATINFDGLRRVVWLSPLEDARAYSACDLCRKHADRLRPPLHWELRISQPAASPGRPAAPATPSTPMMARAFRATTGS